MSSFLITKPPRSGVDCNQAVIPIQSHVFSKAILQGFEYKLTDEFAYFSSVVASHGHIISVVGVKLGPCTILVEQEGLTGVCDDCNVTISDFSNEIARSKSCSEIEG